MLDVAVSCVLQPEWAFRTYFIKTVLGSVYALSAYSPISRPVPDCLDPPKGTCMLFCAVVSFVCVEYTGISNRLSCLPG